MDTPLWQPDERRVEDAHLSAFIKRWQSLTKSKRGDYAALYDWSIREPEGFWTLVWDHFGVIGTRGERILSLGDSMLGSRWFEGSTLNFAENLLRGDDNTTAAERFLYNPRLLLTQPEAMKDLKIFWQEVEP